MRNLLQKLSGNTAGKIVVAFVIALPIWLLITFVDLTPDVETTVTVIEPNQTVTESVSKGDETQNNETTNSTEESETTPEEITEESLTKTLKVEVDMENESRFVSNKYLAVGAYKVDESKYEFSKAIVGKLDDDIKEIYKSKYNVLSKAEKLEIKHIFTEKINISETQGCIIDLGTVNGYDFINVYTNGDGKITISHTIKFEDSEVVAKVIKAQFTEMSKTFNVGDITKILTYFK